ncbi:MAG: ParB/RepB/Spo0J family partition protein, partial [Rhodobacteraceae bacterium HLUCCA24]
MSDKTPKSRGLGRGLSALMADIGPAEEAATPEAPTQRPTTTVPLDRIVPNPEQPRRRFGEEELDELARSIKARGILQPLIVRPDPAREGVYQI